MPHARLVSLVCLAVWTVVSAGFAQEIADKTPSPATFQDAVAPLLKRYCLDCHGPDHQEADLRIDRLSPDVAAGNDAKRWASIATMIDSGEMPPQDADATLTPADRRQLSAWFKSNLPARQQTHWAFQPLRRPAGNSVDTFIHRELARHDMTLSPSASTRQLIRRLYLDLIGLPPVLTKTDRGDWHERWLDIEFSATDLTPANVERIVDALLDSPRYGERWGRHWLDLARYADSNGLHQDRDRPHAWRYRDYVIASFNADKPYGEFIREQLAGDEVDSANPAAWVATGFCRNGPSNDENIAENELDAYLLDQLDNVLATTSQVFLAQTVQCARCHNHKLEPLTLTDYYRLSAVFNTAAPAYVAIGAAESGEAKLSETQLSETQLREAQLREAQLSEPQFVEPRPRDRRQPPKGNNIRALTDTASQPRRTRVLLRGNLKTPGDEVLPGVPDVFDAFAVPFEIQPTPRTTGQRTALANWIASPRNPLTWRVMANRVWQFHFGRGLVDTPSNFGVSGAKPSHPQLLDWLACELRDNGGRLKPLHKQIVLSRVYGQASAHRSHEAQVDPQNRRLWRYPPHRLEAEVVRDSILAISGNLNLKMGGPGIKPRIPAELLEQSKRNVWPKVDRESAKHWRRSVYIYVKRQLPMPFLSLFDSPDTAQTCSARFVSTTPTQALALLNDAFVNEQAGFVARQIASCDEGEQIERLLERVWIERATVSEYSNVKAFFEQRLRANSLSGRMPRGQQRATASARLAALTDVAVVLFNTSQFLYSD